MSLLLLRAALFSYHYPFLYNHPAATQLSTLSLHDALPISHESCSHALPFWREVGEPHHRNRIVVATLVPRALARASLQLFRSEEHTSELQSHHDLVCRLLLEKKKLKRPDRSGDEETEKKTV